MRLGREPRLCRAWALSMRARANTALTRTVQSNDYLQAEAARRALEPRDPMEKLLADTAALAAGLSSQAPGPEPHKGWPPVFLASKV